jgi:5-methylcytosine-specific restriction endonuclease McrA
VRSIANALCQAAVRTLTWRVLCLHSRLREWLKRTERSPYWTEAESPHLRLQPACMACGGVRYLQVHHVRPVRTHADLELDGRNLLTLCMGPQSCHWRIGHGSDWAYFNPDVRADAAEIRSHPDSARVVVARARRMRLLPC